MTDLLPTCHYCGSIQYPRAEHIGADGIDHYVRCIDTAACLKRAWNAWAEETTATRTPPLPTGRE